ncbi:MAG: deoxyribonuclease IV [Candidatus Dependentiae bacterium]
MKQVGLHIRLTDSLLGVAQKAALLNIPFFQCFVIDQATNRIIKPTDQEIEEFVTYCRLPFIKRFLHASYWINLSAVNHFNNKLFEREFNLAQKLEFTHMILHPGAATGSKQKQAGIHALAQALNRILKVESTVKIVLENTAHGGISVGGDFNDFKLLLEQLEHPEKLYFCLDTAHAFSYGYDIETEKGQRDFINLVDKTIGIQKIELIHLNDTKEKKGSKIDRHEIPGKGHIGENALKAFVNQPEFVDLPVLLELPVMPLVEETTILGAVRNW